MRALAALALTVVLALAAAAPHVHLTPQGGEECAVCLVRAGGDVARCQVPDLAPSDLPVGDAAPSPAPSPVCGAPLGAVPGQSPPSA